MTRTDVRPSVHAFLEEFSAAGKNVDPEAQRHFWAETFLNLDPTNAVPLARAAMLEALPRRRELFESIGATASELVEAEEVPLDDRHTVVRTSWRWRLASADGDGELVLRSTYLLRREETGWTIVVYLNHQNVAALIAERASRQARER